MANTYLKNTWHLSRYEYYQAVYWVCYAGLTFANNSLMANPYRWWEVLLTLLFVMAIVYSIVYVFMRYLQPTKTVGLLVGMFAGYALLFYLMAFVWHEPWGERLVGPGMSMTVGVFLFTMFLHWYHAMVEAGLLAAIYRVRRQERVKRRLLKEKHQVELQFLMGQIEPHEQYNMLDIPYAMALERDKGIADALLEQKAYSQYVQRHARQYDGEVSLAEELQHCYRIIDINKRRFEKVYVNVESRTGCGCAPVPVLSISALLKNAFKYGVSWDALAPISLVAECTGDRLEVTIRNRINPQRVAGESTGIGNGNIRQRLELMYGERASLETRLDNQGWYEAILTLNK